MPFIEIPQFAWANCTNNELITIRKSIGDSTEPCLTPRCNTNCSDSFPFILTLQVGLSYKDLIILHVFPFTPAL